MQIRKKLIQASRRGFLRKGVIVGGAVTAGSGVANATNTETPSLVAEPKGAQGLSLIHI